MNEEINVKKIEKNSIWLAQVKADGDTLSRLKPVIVWNEEGGLCQVSPIRDNKPSVGTFKVILASETNGLAKTTYLSEDEIIDIPVTSLIIHLGFL